MQLDHTADCYRDHGVPQPEVMAHDTQETDIMSSGKTSTIL